MNHRAADLPGLAMHGHREVRELRQPLPHRAQEGVVLLAVAPGNIQGHSKRQ